MSRRPAPRLPRARLTLPPLSGADALAIVNILDRAIAAIWRAHGYAMADCLADLHPRPPRCVAGQRAIAADDTNAFNAALAAQGRLPF
jgi:hypothetical protein